MNRPLVAVVAVVAVVAIRGDRAQTHLKKAVATKAMIRSWPDNSFDGLISRRAPLGELPATFLPRQQRVTRQRRILPALQKEHVQQLLN